MATDDLKVIGGIMGRSLSDLYIVGKPLTLDDGQGEPVELFIRKMNEARHSKAIDYANAAKARTKAALKDETSVEYLAIAESIDEFGRDGAIAYLLQDFRLTKEKIVEAELAAADEWAKDDYLEGLQKAWIDGLNDEYARNPEHVDAKRTFDELKRFTDAVEAELEGRIEAFRKDLDAQSDSQLEKQVIEKYGDVRMVAAWLEEFRKCEVWLSTFESDRKTPALHSRADVDDLEPDTIRMILEAIEDLTVAGTEGKDLPEATTS